MRNDRLLFPRKLSRRDFLQQAGLAAGAAAAGSSLIGIGDRAQAAAAAKPVTIGSGKWTYTLDPTWGQLPSGMTYGFGCAVVVEKDRAIGVLTTTDALRALLEYAPHPA